MAYSVDFDDFCLPGTYGIALKVDTLFANRGLSFGGLSYTLRGSNREGDLSYGSQREFASKVAFYPRYSNNVVLKSK